MGNSYFSHIMMVSNYSKLQLFYNETNTVSEHHTLRLNNCTLKIMQVEMLQNSYRVTSKITNTQIQNNDYFMNIIYYDAFFIYAKELGISEMLIIVSLFQILIKTIHSYLLVQEMVVCNLLIVNL